MLAAFTGEEQGLFGSRAKAQEQAEENIDILAMFALDMLAYRRAGVGPQVGLPIRCGLRENNGDCGLMLCAHRVFACFGQKPRPRALAVHRPDVQPLRACRDGLHDHRLLQRQHRLPRAGILVHLHFRVVPR